MKRIGVFVDVSNLYYCIGKKFDKRKLDYKKYLEFVKDFGQIVKSVAYGSQANNEAVGFITCLEHTGYQTKFKTVKREGEYRRNVDWDVGISMDIVNMIERLDIVILGTADGDLAPLVKWATDKGVDVIVLACGVSRELRNVASQVIEIPESLLETPEDAPRQTPVPTV